MATLDDLSNALVRADAAGDVEGAKALAAHINWLKDPAGGNYQPPAGASVAPPPAADDPMSPHFGTSGPGRFIQGMIVDPVMGGAQTIVNAVPKIADMVGAHDYANYVRGTAATMNSQIKDYDATYQRDRSPTSAGQSPDPGVDLMRLGGGIASPINRIVPMAGASGAAGLIGRGASQGALSGLLSPVTNGGDNFFADKVLRVGLDAGLGGAISPIADKVLQLGNQGLQAVRGRFGAGPQIDQTAVDNAIKSSGMDLSQIPQPILASVKQQVGESIASGRALDPVATLRKVEGDIVLGPQNGLTLGQATRDPQQFANEFNLKDIQGAGTPLAQRFNGQSNALISALNAKGADAAPAAIDTGNALITALKGKDAAAAANVKSLYTNFRASGGLGDELPGTAISQKLGDVLDTFGSENVPAAVLKKMNDYGFMGGTKTKTFTLDEADKLNKIINANYNPANRPQAAALDQLRAGIRQTFDEAANNPASAAYAPAVKAASARFSTIDRTPALQAAINDVAPDNFLSKYILKGSQRDVQALRAQTEMPGPTAPFGNAPSVADTMVRQSLVAQLKNAATNGNADELGKFSQKGLNDELAKIGDQRLSVYFTPDEIAQLKQVGRVASYTQVPPPGVSPNYSGSGAAVMNLLGKMAGHIPGHSVIGVPLNMLQNGYARYGQDQAVRSALGAELPTTDVNQLRRFFTGLGN